MIDGRRKQADPDDPMELVGVECDGDPDFMLECIVEEYARMGWEPERILRLFASPHYPMLHNFWRARGSEAIRRKVEATSRRCGVFRFRTTQRPQADRLVEISPAGEGGEKDE